VHQCGALTYNIIPTYSLINFRTPHYGMGRGVFEQHPDESGKYNIIIRYPAKSAKTSSALSLQKLKVDGITCTSRTRVANFF